MGREGMETRTGGTGTSARGAWLALVSHLKRDTAELTGLRGGAAKESNSCRCWFFCRKAQRWLWNCFMDSTAGKNRDTLL